MFKHRRDHDTAIEFGLEQVCYSVKSGADILFRKLPTEPYHQFLTVYDGVREDLVTDFNYVEDPLNFFHGINLPDKIKAAKGMLKAKNVKRKVERGRIEPETGIEMLYGL